MNESLINGGFHFGRSLAGDVIKDMIFDRDEFRFRPTAWLLDGLRTGCAVCDIISVGQIKGPARSTNLNLDLAHSSSQSTAKWETEVIPGAHLNPRRMMQFLHGLFWHGWA